MRRYLILVVFFLISLPVQLSVLGCGSNPNSYCNSNGAGFSTRKGTLVSFALEPQQTGISLSYGQIGTLTAGQGKDCTGAAVSVGTVSYGSSDLLNADISPSGQVCAGRWNRTTDSGVAPYTTCLPTNASEVATMTASANGVASSNAVQVYIHPVVTNVALDTTSTGGSPLTSCISQNQTAQLDATAFVTNAQGQSQLYCAPNMTGVPNCSTVLGHLTYAAQSTSSTAGTGAQNSIVSIDQNGFATAKQPGSALISASIAGTSSSAGVFHTCPPKSITLSANGGTSVTVTPNTPQPTTATVIDTNGNTITGVPMSFTSTDQRTIGVSGSGSITSTFPGSSSVYAVCAPPTCNPAPINQIGIFGNGTPIASNTLNVTSPGSASSFLWMASPNSQYFTPLDLSQGTIGTPVHLPYTPNSMVLDQTGTSLYFGSFRELMVVAAASNTLIKEDVTVPGVVLAVSPSNNQVVINDRDRQIIYVYQPAVAASTHDRRPRQRREHGNTSKHRDAIRRRRTARVLLPGWQHHLHRGDEQALRLQHLHRMEHRDTRCDQRNTIRRSLPGQWSNGQRCEYCLQRLLLAGSLAGGAAVRRLCLRPEHHLAGLLPRYTPEPDRQLSFRGAGRCRGL